MRSMGSIVLFVSALRRGCAERNLPAEQPLDELQWQKRQIERKEKAESERDLPDETAHSQRVPDHLVQIGGIGVEWLHHTGDPAVTLTGM